MITPRGGNGDLAGHDLAWLQADSKRNDDEYGGNDEPGAVLGGYFPVSCIAASGQYEQDRGNCQQDRTCRREVHVI